MSTETLWGFGILGGCLPMLLRIAKSATSDTLPNFYTRWWVWPATAVSGFLGGLTVNLMTLDEMTKSVDGVAPKLAVVLVGYGAPNILANLGGAVGDKFSGDEGDDDNNDDDGDGDGLNSLSRFLLA